MSYLIIVFFLTSPSWAQNPVDVTDQTIKIKALEEEEMYFGFAEGDQIIFSFRELNGKELKEVEIIEYPKTSKFSDFKVDALKNKVITVNRKCIYRFRFLNGAISGRVCRIKIQRIPANPQTVNFNTAVRKSVIQDTVWNSFTQDVVVGYDTVTKEVLKREITKIDTLIQIIFDKTIRVHSETAIGKEPYSTSVIELPANQYEPNIIAPTRTIELVAWSYWIGVGQKAQEDYDEANKHLSSGIAAIGELTGYGALASLAITGISWFSSTRIGDNVRYRFYGLVNGETIVIDYGNVVSAAGRNERIRQGRFNIELINDNVMDGIDVHVRVVAFRIMKTWDDVKHQEIRIIPRKEKQIVREPTIETKVILVNVE